MSSLPDINEVRPVSAADLPCLLEVREVLERYGALDRFGVSLLHDHFPMTEEEILLEVCDPDTRTLTIRPGANNGGGGRFVETSFHLQRGLVDAPLAALLKCKVGCFVDLRDRHRSTHERVSG